MKRVMVVLAFGAVVAFALPAVAGGDKCTCSTVKEAGNGWCDQCDQGAVYGVRLASAKLYQALTGKEIKDADKIKCGGCKKAAKSDGSCEYDYCNAAFHDGKMYMSAVAHTLASGHRMKTSEIKCGGCKKAADAKKPGYCSGCDAGFVSGMAFKGKKHFESASAAMTTLKTAAKAKCTACAVAMVTDGTCKDCKISFKDGEKLKT
ncbi:MAG: hypothetical protein V3T70_08095 [Phycisphaerae bacterium]